MRAISVKQPWAFAIMRLNKNIENRSWKTKIRERVYIQASMSPPDINAPVEVLEAFLAAVKDNDECAKYGGLIGSVEIIDCVSKSDSKWFQGKYGFVLKDPAPIKFIKCKGKLNFFKINLKDLQ